MNAGSPGLHFYTLNRVEPVLSIVENRTPLIVFILNNVPHDGCVIRLGFNGKRLD